MTIVTNCLRLCWFLIALTIVLIYVFVSYDHDAFAYGCHKGMFNAEVLGYSLNHQNEAHIAYNLIGLWFFGVYTIEAYGVFLTAFVYASSVVAAAIAYYIQCYLGEGTDTIIGASGGIYGIVGFSLVIAIIRMIDGAEQLEDNSRARPLQYFILVHFVVTLSYIINTIILLTFDIASMLLEQSQSVAHIAHLGGFGWGFLVGCLIVILDRSLFM